MTKEFREIIVSLRRALALISQSERRYLWLAGLLMLIAGVLTNLPAVILGRLVDDAIAIDNFSFSSASPFIVLIIGVILVREAITVVRKYLVENIATQTEKKQTVALIKHTLLTDISVLQKQQIGSLHGRIFRSIQGLIRLIKLVFLDFLPFAFAALAAIGIALSRKPLLATFMVLVIPAGLFIIVKQISSQKGIRVALLRGKEDIDGKIVETLGGIETVRSLNVSDVEAAKVESVAESLRQKEIKHHLQMALFDAAKYLNEGFFYILVISLSIFLSSQGIISKGDILVYSILFLSVVQPLREIHRVLDEAHESSIKVNDLYELLQRPLDQSFLPVVKQTEDRGGDSFEKAIEVKDLSYAYNKENTGVLDNVSLEIRQGEKIGIAGPSGCGKSTLIKLLLRLAHGYEGQVKIFGKNLNTVSREEIAQRIAYVPQKTYIFSGTVRDNIVYGNPDQKITDDRIMQAAKLASVDKEIMNALGGLDGLITEGGNNLSGGQKQRLAIARLILRNPDILIFDEATSALDNTNELVVQQNLEKYFEGKTMLIIAHRLSTLRETDRILVFDNGQIVQEGIYSDLATTPGLFRSFLERKTEAL